MNMPAKSYWVVISMIEIMIHNCTENVFTMWMNRYFKLIRIWSKLFYNNTFCRDTGYVFEIKILFTFDLRIFICLSLVQFLDKFNFDYLEPAFSERQHVFETYFLD